jgi:dTDP-glucose 4,6-dehydratase
MTAEHILVTGGAGFIGSHLVDALLAEPARRVTVLDRLSTGGSRANLEHHDGDARFSFVLGDVNDVDLVRRVVGDVDTVIHAAAESHVDRSIDEVRGFLETNLMGTQSVLEAVRAAGVRMLMISTDEVYGSGDPAGGMFTEDAPVAPRSPYAHSKAAADLLCSVYRTTFGVDVTVVRGTNAYGPRQIERVVPTFTISALEGLPVPVYSAGAERREFLHVRDWARAALTVMARGEPGVLYNIGGGTEISNLDLAERIVRLVGTSDDLISFVPDRPGHDFRYGVTDERVRGLGWEPSVGFDEGLAETVAWYRANRDWLYRAHDADVVTHPRPPQGVA